MFKIVIRGLKDGEHNVELDGNGKDVEFICKEFATSDIKVKGTLRVLDNHYTLQSKIYAKAKMICDISLDEYEEEIEAEMNMNFIADNELANVQLERMEDDENERIIRSEDKEINLDADVRDILCLALPMKKVAPQHRGKSLEEIFPQYCKSDDKPAHNPWAQLDNLKLN